MESSAPRRVEKSVPGAEPAVGHGVVHGILTTLNQCDS